MERFVFKIFSFNICLSNFGIINMIFLTEKANHSLRLQKIAMICPILLLTLMFLSHNLKHNVLIVF